MKSDEVSVAPLSHTNKTQRAFSIQRKTLEISDRERMIRKFNFLRKFPEDPKTVTFIKSYVNHSSEIFGNSASLSEIE